MTYPYQELEAAGVDIASLVNEKFLNNFSASHHKVNPDLYLGSDYTDELGDRVEIAYKVANLYCPPVPLDPPTPILCKSASGPSGYCVA